MKIIPEDSKKDIYEDLTPTERITRWASIILAFLGVFVWSVKILFF